MRAKLLIVPSLAAVLGAGLLPAAEAASNASVTVTIRSQNTDLSGQVKSTRLKCMKNRTVIVMKQVGTRGGGDDKRFASDITGKQNGVWVWDTGNTGTEGKFYAKVRAITGCKAGASKTIVAKRTT